MVIMLLLSTYLMFVMVDGKVSNASKCRAMKYNQDHGFGCLEAQYIIHYQ